MNQLSFEELLIFYGLHEHLFQNRYALAKYGGGIVQLSGSIAGNTFARNHYGNYVRARTVPINPNTSRQQAVKNYMSSLTTAWGETLTAAQRTAWGLYGKSVAMTNRLGETMFLTGANHYVRSNVPILQAGGTRVDAAPTTFELPETDAAFSVSFSEATQLITVTFDDTMAWCDLDGAHMLLLMGSPQNPQRNFFAGPFRFAGSIDGDAVTPPTSTETIAVPFAITEGQRIWCQARIVLDDGRLSTPFRADALCAA